MIKDDETKYIFTKYLEVALKRARGKYIKKKLEREKREECFENAMEMASVPFFEEDLINQIDIMSIYSGEAKDLRAFFERITDTQLGKILKGFSDTEIRILFSRIFLEMDYAEIAEIMGMQSQKVASIYSYVKKKIRRNTKNGV